MRTIYIDGLYVKTGQSVSGSDVSPDIINQLIDGAPSNLDTLKELADAINNLGDLKVDKIIYNLDKQTFALKEEVPDNVILEAPLDGKLYARLDGNWTEVETGTNVTITLLRGSNLDDELSSSSATISYKEITKTAEFVNNSLTFSVPIDVAYSISFSDISLYQTPNTILVEHASETTHQVVYKATRLNISKVSNLGTALAYSTVTINYGGTTKTVTIVGTDTALVIIPFGSEYTLNFSSIDYYSTPNTISGIANQASINHSITYCLEKIAISLTSDDNSSVAGLTITISSDGETTTYQSILGVNGTGINIVLPYDKEITISVQDREGYITPAVQTFITGLTLRSFTFTYVKTGTATDLSLIDIYGNSISRTTANCYVIKTSGTYTIPLVYGNALKNGSVNSSAYNKNSGSNSMDFVNGNNTIITLPYIETDILIASVQVSLADTDNLITDLTVELGLSCRQIKFTVDSVPVSGANAVISVKDSNGIIIWNWHLWFWLEDLTPVTITNYTGVEYDILPVNLASIYDFGTDKIKNWHYLWGRAVPQICPQSYNSNTNHTNYGNLTPSSDTIASDIYLGISNPNIFYKYDSSYNRNWFLTNSNKNYNLWDANCTTTGASDNTPVKTVYDPSPIGFQVPNGKTFTGFTTSGSNSSGVDQFNVIGSFNNGWNFKKNSSDTIGIFFPTSGCRNYSNGSLSNVGSYGRYWSSAPNSSSSAYYLGFNSSSVNPLYGNGWANGFSVRPVAEL